LGSRFWARLGLPKKKKEKKKKKKGGGDFFLQFSKKDVSRPSLSERRRLSSWGIFVLASGKEKKGRGSTLSALEGGTAWRPLMTREGHQAPGMKG